MIPNMAFDDLNLSVRQLGKHEALPIYENGIQAKHMIMLERKIRSEKDKLIAGGSSGAASIS